MLLLFLVVIRSCLSYFSIACIDIPLVHNYASTKQSVVFEYSVYCHWFYYIVCFCAYTTIIVILIVFVKSACIIDIDTKITHNLNNIKPIKHSILTKLPKYPHSIIFTNIQPMTHKSIKLPVTYTINVILILNKI